MPYGSRRSAGFFIAAYRALWNGDGANTSDHDDR
jgi:hypothetical protein